MARQDTSVPVPKEPRKHKIVLESTANKVFKSYVIDDDEKLLDWIDAYLDGQDDPGPCPQIYNVEQDGLTIFLMFTSRVRRRRGQGQRWACTLPQPRYQNTQERKSGRQQ
jgi:hypothetical protein